jgi:hypothetical protein
MISGMSKPGMVMTLTLALIILLRGLAWGAAGELSVSLQPDTTILAPAQLCTVSIWVDYTDEPFDSYRSVIKWDPTVLHYVTALEGTVMTGPCGSNTWFILDPGMDSVEVQHVLFPCDTAVTGPGAVSDLVFEAQDVGATDVIFDYVMFARDGTTLVARDTEILPHDALAIIGVAGVGPLPPNRSLSLLVNPNPARAFWISYVLPGVDVRERRPSVLSICDARGCIVRHIRSDSGGVGLQRHYWDGTDDDGLQVPPGIYFARLVASGEARTSKLVLVR